MHPILFILALIVGVAHLWVAVVFNIWGEDFRDSAPVSIPFAVIGVAVLTAAGLGIGGVLT